MGAGHRKGRGRRQLAAAGAGPRESEPGTVFGLAAACRGRFTWARRPIQKAANRGIEDRQVKLGCVQPGEAVATFGDALRRLTDRATYLYVDGKRYWYSTQPTVTRLAEDRASRNWTTMPSPTKSSGDCGTRPSPEGILQRSMRVLPERRRARREGGPAGHPRARASAHGEGRRAAPRGRRLPKSLNAGAPVPGTIENAIVFLAADANRLRELRQAVRQYLAWDSIWDDRETLNLDPFQTKQAETKRKNSDETVDARIPETYQWLIVPGQSDPKGEIEWTEIRLQGQDSLAVRASKKLKNEELLMVQLGDVRLRHELDRVPLWRGDHVGVKQLTEDVAKYLYLPRLCRTRMSWSRRSARAWPASPGIRDLRLCRWVGRTEETLQGPAAGPVDPRACRCGQPGCQAGGGRCPA